MDDLSYADIQQQYLGNLVEYQGHIVNVIRVFEDKRVKLYFLQTREQRTVDFCLQDFSSIKRRMGMINVADSALYITRNPVRKMGIGLNKTNLRVEGLMTHYPQGMRETTNQVSTLLSEGFYEMFMNIYPTFGEALKWVEKEAPATKAFDKQFAVSSDRTIHYKAYTVGNIPLGKKTIADIIFKEEYQHLSILLENNHEKTIGHSCPC